MMFPRRIMVIGPSGSGKSTLARAIGARLALPVVHLDALFWTPGWVPSDEDAFRQRAAAAASGETWVIDGNYSRYMADRLARADAVIWLDLPRRIYFPRTVWRMLKNYGRQRSDIGPGCPERVDLAFFRDWVWTYPHRSRSAQAALMAQLPSKMIGKTLRTPRDVRQFVAALPASLQR